MLVQQGADIGTIIDDQGDLAVEDGAQRPHEGGESWAS